MITFDDNFKIYVLPWISLSISLYITWAVYKHVLCALHDKWKLRRVISKKKKEREHAFEKLEHRYGSVDPKWDKILELDDSQLLLELKERRLTASEVLDAYISKALKDTKKYNSITEFIPQAHIWAAHLDEMKEMKGPFHGLPISIKDNINVEGMDSTLGFAKNLHKPELESAPVVKMLMDLGAVPFCKTNVPQTLSSFGCGNPIYGETKNPLNPKLSPGGSSGGEASLVASGGSVFGIGTDSGGSVRIPAHFCGISALKPTHMRLSPAGYKMSKEGSVGMAGVAGFLAKRVELLASIFKELTFNNLQTKYDKLTVPIPWNEQAYYSAKPLRIGYYTSLKFFPAVGDTEKVVLDAKSALESEGHVLLPFEMPDTFEFTEILADLVWADGGANACKLWKDEPIAQSTCFNSALCHIPCYIKSLLAIIMSCGWIPYFFSKRVATFYRGGALSSKDLWGTMERRRKMLVKISSEWKKLNLDLILCPSFPFPAVPIKASGTLFPALIYTAIWNMFDFPSGIVRFGQESGGNIKSYQNEGDFLLTRAQKATEESKGMPISVQLVGLPFHEELVLRGMRELESLRKA